VTLGTLTPQDPFLVRESARCHSDWPLWTCCHCGGGASGSDPPPRTAHRYPLAAPRSRRSRPGGCSRSRDRNVRGAVVIAPTARQPWLRERRDHTAAGPRTSRSWPADPSSRSLRPPREAPAAVAIHSNGRQDRWSTTVDRNRFYTGRPLRHSWSSSKPAGWLRQHWVPVAFRQWPQSTIHGDHRPANQPTNPGAAPHDQVRQQVQDRVRTESPERPQCSRSRTWSWRGGQVPAASRV